MIGQAGIADAFDLDTATDEAIDRAMRKTPRPRRPRRGPRPPKPLTRRGDEDLESLRTADTVTMRRVHNSMTNALRDICRRRGLLVEEGAEQTCLFDALVRATAGAERHLLIEVKTAATPPMCRMAVGQLLDYRRQLPESAAIDLAVLLPTRPPKDIIRFLGYVGVQAMWFDRRMSAIHGQVNLFE